MKVGADDPSLGREVTEAHRREAILAAAPGAGRMGRLIALVILACAVALGVCCLMAIADLAVWLAGRL